MDDLRKKVKMLKALQGISYKEIAEYLELRPKSFYNWLDGQYEFGEEKECQLKYVLNTLWE